MNFTPLRDRVLVKHIEKDEKTAGGIIIPDTAKEKPVEGEVLAAGPGHIDDAGKTHPLTVKEGDKVIFAKWSGTEIEINGETCLVLKESDILGIMKKTV